MSEVGDPIEVCPECDQAGITKRHRTSGPQYRCPRCTHKFDTPRVRDAHVATCRSCGETTLAAPDEDDVVCRGCSP